MPDRVGEGAADSRRVATGTFRLLRIDEILDTVKPIYERAAPGPA